MKIGILTLHSNTNFGGGLQQIALFEILKSMGCEPQFLCVTNGSGVSSFKRLVGILTSYSLRQLAGAFSEGCRRAFHKKQVVKPNWALTKVTDEFNYACLNYTPKFGLDKLPKYVDGCDALIFGSDQIWTEVYSDVLPYFGDGIPQYSGKKIAFAACGVHKKAPIYNRRKIRGLLSDFDAISVRDNTTRQLVNNYTGLIPQIVCDPTMLYDYGAYIKAAPIKGDYIFAYVLGDRTAEWHQKNINKIKKATGISKVVALSTSLDEQFPWADTVITDALAVDWMNILRESKFVYTNSFHAVLFSLKFHRQFIAYYGDIVRSSRMLGLRSQFALDSRIVKQPVDVDLTEELDFAFTDSVISTLAKDSMAFLKNAIGKTVV